MGTVGDARQGGDLMKTFYTNDFTGHQPTQTAAVVIAKDKRAARRKLKALLLKTGLWLPNAKGSWTVHEVTDGPAVMLSDGDY